MDEAAKTNKISTGFLIRKEDNSAIDLHSL